jgi:putative ABC transport system permease protein
VNLGRVDLGLKPDSVVGFSLEPASNGYATPRTAELARNLTGSLAALPGVSSASAAEISTLTGDDQGSNVTVEGYQSKGDESDHVRRNEIGPDYFATLGIPLTSGRELTWRDDASAPKVALINETMERRFFAGRSPIGALFAFGGGKTVRPDILIVGVVRDSKGSEVSEKKMPFVYTPYLQDPKLGSLTFYLRARRDPARLGSAIRAEVERLDPELPIFDLKTLRGTIDESLVTQRLLVYLSAAFGGLAALLAALGIYGVLAFSIAQRRQEIGIRIALGADSASVRRLIFSEVGRFLLIGGLIGLPAAYVLGRIIESILFGVGAADAQVFAGGVLLILVISLAAAYPPSRRATKVDPMVALRSE